LFFVRTNSQWRVLSPLPLCMDDEGALAASSRSSW
jgi:hypothetical protein